MYQILFRNIRNITNNFQNKNNLYQTKRFLCTKYQNENMRSKSSLMESFINAYFGGGLFFGPIIGYNFSIENSYKIYNYSFIIP